VHRDEEQSNRPCLELGEGEGLGDEDPDQQAELEVP